MDPQRLPSKTDALQFSRGIQKIEKLQTVSQNSYKFYLVFLLHIKPAVCASWQKLSAPFTQQLLHLILG